MKRYLFSAILILTACGSLDCATSGAKRLSDVEFMRLVREYNQGAPKEDQIHCEKVKPIGSNLAKWECRRKWSQELETLRTQDLIRRMQRTVGPSGD